MNNWTDNQQRAISQDNKSLLVSAAAGSGKTAVLVERIIRIVTDKKTNIEKLLVVTFTKAAAEEMKQRVSAALLQRLSDADDNERSFISRQINSLPFASISTIHSFCSDIIRRYYHTINLDPSLKVGNETVIAILRKKAMEKILEEEYDAGNQDFLDLVEMFSNQRKDDKLRAIIEKAYDFVMNRPAPEEWANDALENFSVDMASFNAGSFYLELKKMASMKLDHARLVLGASINKTALADNSGKILPILEDEMNNIKALINSLEAGFESFRRVLDQSEFARLSVKTENEDLKDAITKGRNMAKDIINALKKSFGYENPQVMLENINEMQGPLTGLFRLVFQFEKTFREMKMEKGLLDFNDLEHYCVKILSNPAVNSEIRDNYDYVFIDEYQDSNLIQDTIAGHVRKDDNLFLVGDVKQSIYRFRLSDPTLFIEKSKEYQAESNLKNELIHLNTNFRSRNTIINTVNDIFERIMCPYVGEILYDGEEKLNCGVDLPKIDIDQTEIIIIDLDSNNDSEELCDGEEIEQGEEIEDLTNTEAEAYAISQKIKELLEKQICDKEGKKRKITYKDIVILLRSTKNRAEVYQEILMNDGIPVYTETGSGYFDTIEVSLLMDALRIVDNVYQDIPLISVMRSPVFRFTIDEIVSIRTAKKRGRIYDALKTYALEHEDSLSEKVREMLSQLKRWKQECRYMPIDSFLWKLLMDTGYYHFVGAMPGGIQRQANIRVLVDRAREYGDSTLKGLFNFIQFVEELKNTKVDLSTAKILGSMDDVVRIMSIHKSKGLEFPVVILGSMNKKFNMQDLSETVIMHKDLGICPDYVSIDERRYVESIYKSIAKEKISLEILSEEMRVMYVAMTRAKDKLIMIGAVKNLEKKLVGWDNPISEYSLSKANSFLDWVIPAVTEKLKHGQIEDYHIRIIKNSEIVKGILSREKHSISIHEHFNEVEKMQMPMGDVSRRLEWKYPFDDSDKIPAKISVTDLKKYKQSKNLIRIPENYKTPVFLQKKGEMSAAEKGSAVHFVLQNLDLKRLSASAVRTKEIERQILEMVRRELIDDAAAKVLDVSKIAGFFAGSLGSRMLASKEVHREKPFNIKISPKEISKDLISMEEILVQGIIDCFFNEGDGYILIDYKSDYYKDESQKEQLIENYGEQIKLYKNAIEKLTGHPVWESYIHLLHGSDNVRVEI
ncbi:MAG: helicase-exonuclease AddAB subunit AddA [Eubacteriaceae bacterium]|nr:helicase-exonuclease AddAB subunit AddA [Eubacteriaceae bacterium]